MSDRMATGKPIDTTATRARRSRTSLAVALVVAAASLCAIAPTLRAREGSHAEIERGRYLVAAGDCAACHTDERGQPFAGGRAVPTPFGTIYSTNITPDTSTGIGEWTSDDFYRAMHEGIAPGGRHLYPAFPYPWYTKLTRADVDAIRSYLATLAPVRQQNRPSELPWPFDVREVMAGWNALYFDEGTFRSNPQKSAEWNLGAYLVQGLGHCGACHTPKNFAGAVKRDKAFQGGYGENWYATSLGGDLHDGLGQWSTEDIVEYLKTGTNKRAAAFGPPHEAPGAATTAAAGSVKVDADRFARGHGLYIDDCAGCHMDNGEGIAGAFPPLKGNNVVQASDAETLVHVILSGQKTAVTTQKPTGLAMPAFDWKLSDVEVADLATYVRNAWGNRADAIDAGKVADTRRTIVAARTR